MRPITLPVTIDFAQDRPIGTITLDADLLPGQPDYCFALGFKVSKAHQQDGTMVYDEIELVEVSLVTDDDYRVYLERERAKVLPPPVMMDEMPYGYPLAKSSGGSE